MGGAWSGWTGIQPADREWRQCDIFTDRSGGIHAAWKSFANREGHYCHAPSGGSLEGCERIDIPVPDGATAVTMGSSFSTATDDGDGDVYHSIWTLPNDTLKIDVALKAAGSDTFAIFGRPSIDPFPMGDGYDPWPVIGVDDFDRIFVSWALPRDFDTNDTVNTVYISIFDGGAWNLEVIDDNADINVQGRSVLTVTRQAAYLVWRTSGGNLLLVMTEL